MLKCVIIIVIIIILLICLYMLYNKLRKRDLKGGIVGWDINQMNLFNNYIHNIIKEELKTACDIVDNYNKNISFINSFKSLRGKAVNGILGMVSNAQMNIQTTSHSDDCRAEVMKYIKNVRDNVYFLKECVNINDNDDLKNCINEFQDKCITFYNYRYFSDNYNTNKPEYTTRGINKPIKNIIYSEEENKNKYYTVEYSLIGKSYYVYKTIEDTKSYNKNCLTEIIEFIADGNYYRRKMLEKLAAEENVGYVLLLFLNCRFYGKKIFFKTISQVKDKDDLKQKLNETLSKIDNIAAISLLSNNPEQFANSICDSNKQIPLSSNKPSELIEDKQEKTVFEINDEGEMSILNQQIIPQIETVKKEALIKVDDMEKSKYYQISRTYNDINKSLNSVNQNDINKFYKYSDFRNTLINVDKKHKFIYLLIKLCRLLGVMKDKDEKILNALVIGIETFNTLNNDEEIKKLKEGITRGIFYDKDLKLGYSYVETYDDLRKFISGLSENSFELLKIYDGRLNATKNSELSFIITENTNDNDIDNINFDDILTDVRFINEYMNYLSSSLDEINDIITYIKTDVQQNDIAETGTFENVIGETCTTVAKLATKPIVAIGNVTGLRKHDHNHYYLSGIYRLLYRTKRILSVLNGTGNYTSIDYVINKFNEVNTEFLNTYGDFFKKPTDDVYTLFMIPDLVSGKKLENQKTKLIIKDNGIATASELINAKPFETIEFSSRQQIEDVKQLKIEDVKEGNDVGDGCIIV